MIAWHITSPQVERCDAITTFPEEEYHSWIHKKSFIPVIYTQSTVLARAPVPTKFGAEHRIRGGGRSASVGIKPHTHTTMSKFFV